MTEDMETGLVHAIVEMENVVQTKKADETNPQPEIKETNPLKARLIEMLTENTGVHMMDSGGDNNRAWQRNRQVEDWDGRPETTVDAYSSDDWHVTKDVYHFLYEHLEITEQSEKLDVMFQALTDKSDDYYLADMEEFAKQFDNNSRIENTYNFENTLNQTLQFVSFEYNDIAYLILQIHGGADVRGGYTKPRIFAFSDEPANFHCSMTDINCTCSECGNDYYTDDCGCHWYNDRGSGNDSLDVEVKDGKIFHKDCGGELKFR